MIDDAILALIAITDDLRDGLPGLVERTRAAVRGGASMVQVRLKHEDARTLVEVARAIRAAVDVPVVVNDRVDVALVAGAAGVHLGVDDLPVEVVRRMVPPGFLIGASVGTDIEVPGGTHADYVGVGPVFGTLSKNDAGPALGASEFARLARATGRPAVAIGGITAENISDLRGSGARGVAVIRGLLGAQDPETAARALRRGLA